MIVIVKWIVGILSGLCLLVLLAQAPLFVRGIVARLSGKIPKGEALIRFLGRAPTDAIGWYTRMYLLGVLGVVVTAWIVCDPWLPESVHFSGISDSWNVIILVAAGLAAFRGAAMCATHCGDYDANLKQHGA